jgi:polysaccharide export outer membrane protein
LDRRVVSVLERADELSLQGTFGSPRGAVSDRINRGDQIQIVLWEAAAGGLFSSAPTILGGPSTGSRSVIIPEQTVGEDGSVTVPYADAGTNPPSNRVRVEGLTPRQAEAAIVARLTGRALEPQALVTITKNVSNTVTVLGEVTQGARVPLTGRGDRILDVVASAGGTRAPAHEVFLTLMRDGKALRVPMQAILRDPKEDIRVAPGDVITVAREPQTFTAIGATGTNNVLAFDALGMNLEEAIGKAGGLNDQRADPSGVFVIRFEQTKLYDQLGFARPSPEENGTVPVIYRLDMRDANAFFLARRFPMHHRDTLFVSNAPAAEIAKVGSIISTFLVPAGTIVAVGAIVR